MKKLVLSLAALCAAASLGWAQTAAQAPAEKPADAKATEAKAPAKTKRHKFDAEVVSVDVEKKTLTYKAEGAEKTAPVGSMAIYGLKKLKAGDKVVLTCKDDAASGEHQAISAIRMATPEAAKPAAAAPAEKKE